jgi:hypothetical protein
MLPELQACDCDLPCEQQQVTASFLQPLVGHSADTSAVYTLAKLRVQPTLDKHRFTNVSSSNT